MLNDLEKDFLLKLMHRRLAITLLSRSSKEQLDKEVDMVRSIEKKLALSDKTSVH